MNELPLIERETCPVCNAGKQRHCRKKNSERRIYPFAEGSAGPEWVHPERRVLAIARGHLRETPGE